MPVPVESGSDAPPGTAMPKRSTLRLTTRSIAALPATGSDTVHWDRDLAGFGVRVQHNGRMVYVVQSRGPASLKRATLGPVAGEAINQRRREAARIIDRIKRGLEPIPPQPEPGPTVTDLAARCMRAYVMVHCKPKTEKLYRTAIDRNIVPALGTMAVKDVRSSHVIELHDCLRDTLSMANHVAAMLSKQFSLAQTWELVPRGRNPCKAVRHYREQSRERFLTPEEYRSVGAALREVEANGSMWPPAIAAIRLLMLTGCRKTEIMTLPWKHVDLDRAEMRIVNVKTGDRTVHLSPSAVNMLAALALPREPGNPWVVPGAKAGTHMADIDGAWQSIRAQAFKEGLPPPPPHGRNEGQPDLPPGTTAKGRHCQVITPSVETARYAHLARDSVRESPVQPSLRLRIIPWTRTVLGSLSSHEIR